MTLQVNIPYTKILTKPKDRLRDIEALIARELAEDFEPEQDEEWELKFISSKAVDNPAEGFNQVKHED